MALVNHLELIYQAAIKAVSPYKLVRDVLKFVPADIPVSRVGKPGLLKCSGHCFEVDSNVKIVGCGKAAAGMVKSVLDTVGPKNVSEGIVSVPVGSCYHDLSPVRVLEGAAYNLPDHNSESAAKEILSLVSSATTNDLVVVLVTGGGSALLSLPEGNITIDEKKAAITTLANAGASIEEVNRVRQCISRTKAGKLGVAAYPAKVLSLILSDIIGDPLEVIASGPTVVQDTSPQHCISIFEKYNITKSLPDSVIGYLTNLTEENIFSRANQPTDHIVNILIGNNEIATRAAYEVASSLGYCTNMWSCGITGEAKDIGILYSSWVAGVGLQETHTTNDMLLSQSLINQFCKVIQDVQRPLCLIGSGEPVVNVRGSGKGGRNQELVLSALLWLSTLGRDAVHKLPEFLIASVGTDGQDGPTDYAGAYVDKPTLLRQLDSGLNTALYLENNDSNTFFKLLNNGRNLIQTGSTGTNVMDVHIILIM